MEASPATPGEGGASANPSQLTPALLQVLRLSLGGEMHAVRIDSVREILEVSKITPLPHMPEFMRGVMNLRGSVIPVVDLSARLGLAVATASRRSCVVIVDIPLPDYAGSRSLGALCDAVYEVVDADTNGVEPVPGLGTRIDPRFIRSMVRVRGQATPELDLATILDEQTLRNLVRTHGELH